MRTDRAPGRVGAGEREEVAHDPAWMAVQAAAR